MAWTRPNDRTGGVIRDTTSWPAVQSRHPEICEAGLDWLCFIICMTVRVQDHSPHNAPKTPDLQQKHLRSDRQNMIHEKINSNHPQSGRFISCLGRTALGILILTTDQINMVSAAERGEGRSGGVGAERGGGGGVRGVVCGAAPSGVAPPEVPPPGLSGCVTRRLIRGGPPATLTTAGWGQRAPRGETEAVCVCVLSPSTRFSPASQGMLLPARMKLASHRVMSAIVARVVCVCVCVSPPIFGPLATPGAAPAITSARRH